MTACRPLPFLLLAILSAGCGPLGDAAVVTIGSRSLTARDLREIHAGMDAGQRPSLATRDERAGFVDWVVERVLLEEHGRQLVANGWGGIEPAARAAREDMLVRRLRTILGSDVPLDSVTAVSAYERMGVAHRVRSVAFAGEAAARAALAQLAPGQGLESLPGRVDAPSTDAWMAWSVLPDPLADAVVEAAIGDVVGPVESRTWWWLVQVVDRRGTDLEPYDALRPRILHGLRARAEAGRTRELVGTLLAGAGLSISPAMISLLAERTRDAILRPGAVENEPDWAVPELADEDAGRSLAEWRNGRITVADYVELLRDMRHAQRPRSSGLELAIRALVKDAAERRLLVAEAERRGLGQDWWVRHAVEADRSERLIRLAVSQLEVGQAQAAASDSLLELLRSSQPGILRSEARARVLRFDLPTRELAEREIQAIRAAGGGLARLRDVLRTEPPFPGTYQLLELSRGAVSDSSIAGAIFDGPPGVASGPHEAFGGWVVAVCLEIAPPRELTDEEVRAAMSPSSVGPEAVKEWVRMRREQRGVTVNQGALDDLGPGG